MVDGGEYPIEPVLTPTNERSTIGVVVEGELPAELRNLTPFETSMAVAAVTLARSIQREADTLGYKRNGLALLQIVRNGAKIMWKFQRDYGEQSFPADSEYDTH